MMNDDEDPEALGLFTSREAKEDFERRMKALKEEGDAEVPLGWRRRFARGRQKLSDDARNTPAQPNLYGYKDGKYASLHPADEASLENSDEFLKQKLAEQSAFQEFREKASNAMAMLSMDGVDKRFRGVKHEYEQRRARVWINPRDNIKADYCLPAVAMNWLEERGAIVGGHLSEDSSYFLDGFIVHWDSEARYAKAKYWDKYADEGTLLLDPEEGEEVYVVQLPGDDEKTKVDGLIRYRIVPPGETESGAREVYGYRDNEGVADDFVFPSAVDAALNVEALLAHENEVQLFYFVASRIGTRSEATGQWEWANLNIAPGLEDNFRAHLDEFEQVQQKRQTARGERRSDACYFLKLSMHEAALAIYTRHHPETVWSGEQVQSIDPYEAYDEEDGGEYNFYDTHTLLGLSHRAQEWDAQRAQKDGAEVAGEANEDDEEEQANKAVRYAEQAEIADMVEMAKGRRDGSAVVIGGSTFLVHLDKLGDDTRALIDAAMHFGPSHEFLREQISGFYDERKISRETACALARTRASYRNGTALNIVAPIAIDVHQSDPDEPGAGLLIDFDSLHRQIRAPGVLFNQSRGSVGEGVNVTAAAKETGNTEDEKRVLCLLTDEQKMVHAALRSKQASHLFAEVSGIELPDEESSFHEQTSNFQRAQADRVRRAEARISEALRLRRDILSGLATRVLAVEDDEGNVTSSTDSYAERCDNLREDRRKLAKDYEAEITALERLPVVSFVNGELLPNDGAVACEEDSHLLSALACSLEAQHVAAVMDQDYLSELQQRLASADLTNMKDAPEPPWAIAQARYVTTSPYMCTLYVHCMEQLGWQLVNRLATGLLPQDTGHAKRWANGQMRLCAELVSAPSSSYVPASFAAAMTHVTKSVLWGYEVLACVVGPQVMLVDAGSDPERAVAEAAAGVGATSGVRDSFVRVETQDGRTVLAVSFKDRYTLTVRMRARPEPGAGASSLPVVQFAVSGTRAQLPYRFAAQTRAMEALGVPRWAYGYENLAGCYSDWMLVLGRSPEILDKAKERAIKRENTSRDSKILAEDKQVMRAGFNSAMKALATYADNTARRVAATGDSMEFVGTHVDSKRRPIAALQLAAGNDSRSVRARMDGGPSVMQRAPRSTTLRARATPMRPMQAAQRSTQRIGVQQLDNGHSSFLPHSPTHVETLHQASHRHNSTPRGPARQLLASHEPAVNEWKMQAGHAGALKEIAGRKLHPLELQGALIRRPPRNAEERETIMRLLTHHHADREDDKLGALQRAMLLSLALYRPLDSKSEEACTREQLGHRHIVDAETAMAVHMGYVESLEGAVSYVLDPQLAHVLALALTGLKLWLREDDEIKARLLAAVINQDSELQDLMDLLRHYNHQLLSADSSREGYEPCRVELDKNLARTILHMVHSCVLEVGGEERLRCRVSVDSRFVQCAHAFKREARCPAPTWNILTRIFGALAFMIHERESGAV